MISAKEARALADNYDEIKIDEVMKGIEESCGGGNYHYTFGGTLSDRQKSYLKNLGYTVSTGQQYNEPYVTIGW